MGALVLLSSIQRVNTKLIYTLLVEIYCIFTGYPQYFTIEEILTPSEFELLNGIILGVSEYLRFVLVSHYIPSREDIFGGFF